MAPGMLVAAGSYNPCLNSVRLESRARPVVTRREALTMQNTHSKVGRYQLYPDCTLNVCTNYTRKHKILPVVPVHLMATSSS